MALNLSKQYTFAPNTTIASAQVNTDLDDLYNAFSGLEAETKTLAKLKVDIDPTTALEVATKQYVDHYAAWRRPRLSYISATLVDVENNTGTNNQTQILFPDGALLSVTEDTSSSNKYRRFDITATASYNSGTEDSGLLSGLTEATNTWYAIYAVKSVINSSNFVLVGSTTLPIRANYAQLITDFNSATSWVYLGLIRNGDTSGTTGDILAFTQSGNQTTFSNTVVGTNVSSSTGIRMANSNGATNLTYTYSAGTGSTAVPNNIGLLNWSGATEINATGAMFLSDAANAVVYSKYPNTATSGTATIMVNQIPAAAGVRMDSSNASDHKSIFLNGFSDYVLGVGSNPLI